MKFGFKEFVINSPFETTQCGHLTQTNLLSTYHDDLYCREFVLDDGEKKIVHLSFDLLGFGLEQRNILDAYLKEYYNDQNVHLITSATHTHYGNDVTNPKYVEYLLDLLKKEIVDIELNEYPNMQVSHKIEKFNKVGKSRISGYETDNELLCLLQFKNDEDILLNIIIHNVHPTILHANVPFFSAEFPGYTLTELKKAYPGQNFTYMSGAMGDISSRFTRSGQDYAAVEELGKLLVEEIKNIKESEANYQPLTVKYEQDVQPFHHVFDPIDTSLIREGLTERELETIRYGQIARSNIDPNKVAKHALFTVLRLSDYNLVFYPSEIFSDYLNYVDTDKTIIVSYSNGYNPYVLPIDFQYITYEMFTDTLDNETKKDIIERLKRV